LGGTLNQHSNRTKKLISEKQIGRKLSKDHKNNISNAIKGSHKNLKDKLGRPVECVNVETLEIIKFNSISEAIERLNLPRAGISGSCTGRYTHVKKYIFKYSDDNTRNLLEEIDNFQITNSKKITGTHIKTGAILEFRSSEEAARYLNKKHGGSKIRDCIAGRGKSAYGYT
jgi:hypothetical protein